MKTIDLFLIVCALCFSSCSKKDNSNSALSIKSISPQVATRSSNAEEDRIADTSPSNTEEDLKYDTLVWCTGNDILWYNATTGQLKMSESPHLNTGKLLIFLEDKLLFCLETSIGISSTATFFPCINWDPGRVGVHFYKGVPFQELPGEPHYHDSNCEWGEYVYDNPGYYISKGYPRWDPKTRNIYPNWVEGWTLSDEEREKNWKAIEPEWNIFIEQLKKEGKYREQPFEAYFVKH